MLRSTLGMTKELQERQQEAERLGAALTKLRNQMRTLKKQLVVTPPEVTLPDLDPISDAGNLREFAVRTAPANLNNAIEASSGQTTHYRSEAHANAGAVVDHTQKSQGAKQQFGSGSEKTGSGAIARRSLLHTKVPKLLPSSLPPSAPWANNTNAPLHTPSALHTKPVRPNTVPAHYLPSSLPAVQPAQLSSQWRPAASRPLPEKASRCVIAESPDPRSESPSLTPNEDEKDRGQGSIGGGEGTSRVRGKRVYVLHGFDAVDAKSHIARGSVSGSDEEYANDELQKPPIVGSAALAHKLPASSRLQLFAQPLAERVSQGAGGPRRYSVLAQFRHPSFPSPIVACAGGTPQAEPNSWAAACLKSLVRIAPICTHADAARTRRVSPGSSSARSWTRRRKSANGRPLKGPRHAPSRC